MCASIKVFFATRRIRRNPEALVGRDVYRERVSVQVEAFRLVEVAVDLAEVAGAAHRGVGGKPEAPHLRRTGRHVRARVAERTPAVRARSLYRQDRTVAVSVPRHVVRRAVEDADRVPVRQQ